MKKIIINHRSQHHSGYSGYSRLIDYLGDVISVPSDGYKGIVPYRIAKWIASNLNQKKGEYNSDSIDKELELYRLLKQEKDNKIVHYLNAERNIRFLVNSKQFFTDTTFLGTFHKPSEVLKQKITDNAYVKKLDGAIAVGVNQVDFLKNWLNTDKVSYIPHGVDTQFFKPDFTKREESTLLFVGQHLRDFEALNYCIPRIAEKIKDLKVNVVLHKSYKKFVEPHSSVAIFSNVEDTDLRDFYQRATALFLPMKNSTACNSILEAMAVGVPIISSDVGGNYGYIDRERAILVSRGKNDFLIDATIDLLNNEDKIMNMSNMSLEASKKLEWGKVAKQVNEFYKHCALN